MWLSSVSRPPPIQSTLQTGLNLCDYLMPGEEVDASEERSVELLDLGAPSPPSAAAAGASAAAAGVLGSGCVVGQILEPEAEAVLNANVAKGKAGAVIKQPPLKSSGGSFSSATKGDGLSPAATLDERKSSGIECSAMGIAAATIAALAAGVAFFSMSNHQ